LDVQWFFQVLRLKYDISIDKYLSVGRWLNKEQGVTNTPVRYVVYAVFLPKISHDVKLNGKNNRRPRIRLRIRNPSSLSEPTSTMELSHQSRNAFHYFILQHKVKTLKLTLS
jgi:hypothetical protein